MKEGWKPGKERLEPKEKLLSRSPSRRDFLIALAALGVTTAAAGGAASFVGKAIEEAQIKERKEKPPLRERLLDAAIKTVGQNVRSPQVMEALQGKGKDPLSVIMRAVEFPILPKHLSGTSYDVEPLSIRYQTQLALFPDEGVQNRPLANRVALRTESGSTQKEDFFSVREAGYGNGVYWSDHHLILTAEHVIAMFHPERPELGKGVIDIGLLRTPKRFAASENTEVVHDAGTLHDSGIHGSFVAIGGIDPDATSKMSGRKIYPGIAVKISRPIAELILKSDPNPDPRYRVADDEKHITRTRLEKSFMIVLPKGEALWNATTKSRPAMGLSGSGAFARQEDKLVFGGTFWGAMQIEVDGQVVDVGFFHGIDVIREATKEIRVESIPDPR